jgi:hypothetical protein
MRPRANPSIFIVLVAGVACAVPLEEEEADTDTAEATATVTATLDRDQYAAGQAMVLTVAETFTVARTTTITDGGGHAWSKTSDNGKTLVFTATAARAGSFTVTATVKPQSGTAQSGSDSYRVDGGNTAARWPGHQPGRIYLGMSAPSEDWSGSLADLVPQVPGVRRKFYEWNDASAESSQIASDHAARRLPWVSFKPPVTGGTVPQRWDAIASGAHDADIRARARRYAALDAPVIVTFHHEPSNDAPDADGARWAAAWIRIYDVMDDETGLANTTFAPIVGDWLFNPKNSQDPARWILPGVISRQPFLGIDLYQNNSSEGFEVRIERILAWLADHGDPGAMIGIGETGATDLFFEKNAARPTAVEWWLDSWTWAVANTDRVGVVSYFNSTRNSKPDHYWALDESTGKLDAFKTSLASPTTCLLPP